MNSSIPSPLSFRMFGPAFAVFMLLFLSGCFTPNMRSPCCTSALAVNGVCEKYLPAGPDTDATIENCTGSGIPGSYCNTYYCVVAQVSATNNQTVYVKYTNGGGSQEINCTDFDPENKSLPCNNIGYCLVDDHGEEKSISICTDRKEMEYDKECKTMLCGNIKYVPKQSFFPEPNKNIFYSGASDDGYTQNLYNGRCGFYVLDKETIRKLQKGDNIFVNSLRFGLGSSISDYEEGRLYFPLSDRFCGLTPVETSEFLKDRYQNYLNIGAGSLWCADSLYAATCGFFAGPVAPGCEKSRIICAYDSLNPSLFTNRSMSVGCAGISKPPMLSSSGSYLYSNYQEGTGKFLDISKFVASYVLPDVKQYKFGLYGAYWSQIYNDEYVKNITANISGVIVKYNVTLADYECQLGSECLSGICSKSDWAYKRSFCVDNSTGNLVNCLCYEVGYRGSLTNQVRCEPFADAPGFTPLQADLHEAAMMCHNYTYLSGTCGNAWNCSGETCIADIPACCLSKNGDEMCYEDYGCTGRDGESCSVMSGGIAPSKDCVGTNNLDQPCTATISGDGFTGFCGIDGLCGNYDANKGLLGIKIPGCAGGALFTDPCSGAPTDTWTFKGKCEIGPNGYSGITLAGDIILFNESKEINGINVMGYAQMPESEFAKSMFASKCGATGYFIPSPAVPFKLSDDPWGEYHCLQTKTIIEKKRVDYCLKSVDITAITNFTQCNHDDGKLTGIPLPNFPALTGSIGWCESCTFANMFSINLDEYWKKYKEYDFLCPKPKGGMVAIALGIGDDKCGGRIREYINNLANLRKRMDAYFQANAMPIVWYLEGDTGYTYVSSSGYNVQGGCKEGTEANPADVGTAIRRLLLGEMFYYQPDYVPFFEIVTPSCWKHKTTSCGRGPECQDKPVEARSIVQSGFGESGGPSKISKSESNESSANLWCPPWNKYDRKWVSCKWTAGYFFYKRAIGNSAALVVVATDSMDQDTVARRARELKEYSCPNCLIGIYSPDLNEERLSNIFGCSTGDMGCKLSSSQAWKYVDVILYDTVANRNENAADVEVLSNLTDTSRRALQLFGKPTIPNSFAIDESKNGWSGASNRTYDFMSYALHNQSDIVTSGIFAINYRKWLGADSVSLLSGSPSAANPYLVPVPDQKFCGFQKAINLFMYPTTKKTVFLISRAVNSSDPAAQCVKCTESDMLVNQCSSLCVNGQNCTLPSGAGGNYKGYRCQANIAIEPCVSCTQSGNLQKYTGLKMNVTTELWIRIVYNPTETLLQKKIDSGTWITEETIPTAYVPGSISFCMSASGLACTQSSTTCTIEQPVKVLSCSG